MWRCVWLQSFAGRGGGKLSWANRPTDRPTDWEARNIFHSSLCFVRRGLHSAHRRHKKTPQAAACGSFNSRSVPCCVCVCVCMLVYVCSVCAQGKREIVRERRREREQDERGCAKWTPCSAQSLVEGGNPMCVECRAPQLTHPTKGSGGSGRLVRERRAKGGSVHRQLQQPGTGSRLCIAALPVWRREGRREARMAHWARWPIRLLRVAAKPISSLAAEVKDWQFLQEKSGRERRRPSGKPGPPSHPLNPHRPHSLQIG